MFNDFIVQPIFNLLALIYALIPGHNFGVAIVIFTIIIRLLLWPLVRKQLHQAKLMRRIQPQLKQIAKQTKGDKKKQAELQMELYKERGINPFSSIGVALLQLPILFGLYIGLQRVSKDPDQMVEFAYPFVQNLPWMQKLSENIHLFDDSLFGLVDLSRAALADGSLYIPALIIVVASVVIQYFQAKQLIPNDKDARSLRDILRDAGKGEQADQSEVGAAIGRSTVFLLPGMIFVFTIGIASALSLYWFVGGLVAFIQQSIVLRDDTVEMEELSGSTESKTSKVSKDSGDAVKVIKKTRAIPGSTARVVESEVIESPARQPEQPTQKPGQKSGKSHKSRNKKRRRR